MGTAQERFGERYVTSTQLCEEMGVSRVSVFNRRKLGGLPDAIELRCNGRLHLLLWERVAIAPHLAAWRRAMGR